MSWVRLSVGANSLGFNDVVFSVVDNVTLSSETSMVTSSISMICRLSL